MLLRSRRAVGPMPSTSSVMSSALLRRHAAATCVYSSPPYIISAPPVRAAAPSPPAPAASRGICHAACFLPFLPGTRPASFRHFVPTRGTRSLSSHTQCGGSEAHAACRGRCLERSPAPAVDSRLHLRRQTRCAQTSAVASRRSRESPARRLRRPANCPATRPTPLRPTD